MKDGLRLLLALVVGFLVVVGLLFAFGVVGNKYNATVGRKSLDVQRENFEHSKSYVHGKADDLAKYKREYERAKTPEEKAQIRNWILSEFANFDKSLIENRDLYNFLIQMERGN